MFLAAKILQYTSKYTSVENDHLLFIVKILLTFFMTFLLNNRVSKNSKSQKEKIYWLQKFFNVHLNIRQWKITIFYPLYKKF